MQRNKESFGSEHLFYMSFPARASFSNCKNKKHKPKPETNKKVMHQRPRTRLCFNNQKKKRSTQPNPIFPWFSDGSSKSRGQKPRDSSHGEQGRARQAVKEQTRRAFLSGTSTGCWHAKKPLPSAEMHRNFLHKEEDSFKQC